MSRPATRDADKILSSRTCLYGVEASCAQVSPMPVERNRAWIFVQVLPAALRPVAFVCALHQLSESQQRVHARVCEQRAVEEWLTGMTVLELQGVAPNAQALSPQLWTGYAGVWLTLRSEEAEAYSAASCEASCLQHMPYLPPALLSHRPRGWRAHSALQRQQRRDSDCPRFASACVRSADAHNDIVTGERRFSRVLTPTSSSPQRPRRPVRRRP